MEEFSAYLLHSAPPAPTLEGFLHAHVSTQGGKVSLDFDQVGGTRNWHHPVLQRAVPAYPSTVANYTRISVAAKCVIMCISEL